MRVCLVSLDTVYARGVADMPVLPNSKKIAAYMKAMPKQQTNNKEGFITSLNAAFFNLPVFFA